MALGPTQPLTEMSTKNVPSGKVLPVLKADYHGHLRADCLENVAALMTEVPMGLHGLLRGQRYLLRVSNVCYKNEKNQMDKHVGQRGDARL
jgi:hypothetical protein